MLTLTIAAVPSAFGPSYRNYRQPDSDRDAAAIIPKSAQHAGAIPKDSDWVDASRFSLRRNGTQLEILGASVGPIELRSANGSRRTSTESYLVVWLRRRNVDDGSTFADRIRGGGVAASVLQFTLTDNCGMVYPKQEVALASGSL